MLNIEVLNEKCHISATANKKYILQSFIDISKVHFLSPEIAGTWKSTQVDLCNPSLAADQSV